MNRMNRETKMKVLGKLAPLLVLLGVVSLAYAHGASVEIAEATAVPGDVISVSGEGVTANGEIQLTLQGILRDYSLGSARGGKHGRFETDVTLPEDLPPGEYTLIAAGDEKATVKLTVTLGAESEMAHGEQAKEDHGGSEDAHGKGGSPTGEAHAEAMHIEREKTAAEWVFSLGVILLSSVLGVGLLMRGHREE